MSVAWDETAISAWLSEPHEGLGIYRAKAVSSFLLLVKTFYIALYVVYEELFTGYKLT